METGSTMKDGKPLSTEELDAAIEAQRAQLHELLCAGHSLTSEQTLLCSRKLDKLLQAALLRDLNAFPEGS